MVDGTIAHARDNYEEIYLLGVRLRPDSQECDLFALSLYYEVARKDANRPLTSAGRIVFFRRPDRADYILSLGDAAFRKYGRAPLNVAYVYDIPAVLSRLERSAPDEDAVILTLINELLDFVAASGRTIPARSAYVLERFADWLTFEKQYANFFAAREIERDELLDAILWSIGAVVASAAIVD